MYVITKFLLEVRFVDIFSLLSIYFSDSDFGTTNITNLTNLHGFYLKQKQKKHSSECDASLSIGDCFSLHDCEQALIIQSKINLHHPSGDGSTFRRTINRIKQALQWSADSRY